MLEPCEAGDITESESKPKKSRSKVKSNKKKNQKKVIPPVLINANAHKLEPLLIEEIKTCIGEKFKEQEIILKKIIKKELNSDLQFQLPQKHHKYVFENTIFIFAIKAIIFIIFNFLVILLIIWLLNYLNSYDTKIIEIISSTVGDGNYVGKRIINWIVQKISLLVPILTYLIYKNISKENTLEDITPQVGDDRLFKKIHLEGAFFFR